MSTKDRLGDSDENESFVSRWSRKKKADLTEEEKSPAVADAPDAPDAPEAPKIPLNTVLPAATSGRMSTGVEADRIKAESVKNGKVEAALTDADMPDLETLGEGSDFTGFMSPGVSDKLRKMALRKLFAGAGFNIRDGLDDYDEDFTDFAPLGDIVTCDMKHRAELEEEKRLKALAEAEATEKEAEKEAEDKALAEKDSDSEDAAEENPDELDHDPEQSGAETLSREPQAEEDENIHSDEITIAEEEGQESPSRS